MQKIEWRKEKIDNLELPEWNPRQAKENGLVQFFNDKPLIDFHPCPKPVKLLMWLIESFTDRGMTAIDPFGGSGTTLIACERLGRQCRMMEIDPQYTRVVIDRWEQETGKKAEKIT